VTEYQVITIEVGHARLQAAGEAMAERLNVLSADGWDVLGGVALCMNNSGGVYMAQLVSRWKDDEPDPDEET
jgi:Na+-transporting methylmalonyl-CoA/oxaloacetate decarboxylase beta subunit